MLHAVGGGGRGRGRGDGVQLIDFYQLDPEQTIIGVHWKEKLVGGCCTCVHWHLKS